jgi:DNA adenine methylase
MTRTILKYPGSKGSLRDRIIAMMPAHRLYCEPYGGSAAVMLAKPPTDIEWYNDTFGELLQLFRLLRSGTAVVHKLIKLVELTPFSRLELDLAREIDPSASAMEQVRRFLVRSWFSYNGSLANQKTGFRTSKTDTKRLEAWNGMGDRLAFAAERFKNVQIEQIDAVKIMLVLDAKDALFYVDPPYVESTLNFREKQVYHQPFGLAEHYELLSCVNNLKGKVILSGYRNIAYDSALKDWYRTDIQHTTQAGSRKTECLWTNFDPLERP